MSIGNVSNTARDCWLIMFNSEMRTDAKAESDKLRPKIEQHSLTDGKQTYGGCLGEEMFKRKFKVDRKRQFNYDFRLRNKTIEVKSKIRTVDLKLHYTFFMNEETIKQNADILQFNNVVIDNKGRAFHGQMAGWLPTYKFWESATFRKKGTRDMDGHERWCDTWEVTVDQLYKIEHLLTFCNE